MQSKAFLLTSVLALAFLAGCSDAPASGELTAASAPLAIAGTATVQYTHAKQPVQGQPGVCVPNEAPASADDYKCVNPNTNITGHFMNLQAPDGGGWAVFAVNTSGGQRSLGALTEAEPGMYDLQYSIGEDISSMYQILELRMGEFLYATAPATAGAQTFVLADITGVTATGSYKGRDLTVDVSGLPGNNTKFTGHLYLETKDANGNVTLASAINFPIVAGQNTFTDEKRDIGDYAEFHIHVGNSKINLYKATL